MLGYQHPHKGLVTPLLYPVPRDTDTGDESSGELPPCCLTGVIHAEFLWKRDSGSLLVPFLVPKYNSSPALSITNILYGVFGFICLMF